MKDYSIEIDGVTYIYNLLSLKSGQSLKSPQGDVINTAILGVSGFLVDVFEYKITTRLTLGTWKDRAAYEGFLKKEPFSQFYSKSSLEFSERGIPTALLNNLIFDENYLFGVEFSEQFLLTLLNLPDGEGGKFGDKWEIIYE